MRIGFDIMGGDFAPKEAIAGAILALQEIGPNDKIVLIGDSEQASNMLKSNGISDDRFEIVRPTNTIISLEIFNRWGNAVYTSVDYKNDWRGKGSGNFLGQDVPDGTYYYIVNATNKTTNQVRNYVGFITLKR